MRIGVVAPARGLSAELAGCAKALCGALFPDVELVIHPQCFLTEGHFAGPDAARAAAFFEIANDPAIDAVWFARGGYGSNRILADVMAGLGPAAQAKTYLGYSDAGFLLAALYARGIGRVAHGPMVADLLRTGGEAAFARALAWLARADPTAMEHSGDDAPAAAFNLAILSALVGTRWLPDLTGHVVMIEDISEPLYRIDRMLFQIAAAPQLNQIAGIRLGRIGDIIPNDPPWIETPEAMMARWCGVLGVPFLGIADIGHDVDNKVVPFG